MTTFLRSLLGISLLYCAAAFFIIRADNLDTEQNLDALNERQASSLVENQPVKVSEDGRSLLVPQISQLDMQGKIRNHATYDQQGNRYLQLMDGNPSIKLDSNRYIKLFDGSMVNAASLACPVHFYNDIVIFRDYGMGLAFPAGWKIIVQTSDKIFIINGPFTLTSKQTDSNRVGNELDTGMLIKNIGAFRIGSKWDNLFDNLRKAGLVLSRTNTNTNFSWCEFKLDPPSPLLKAYFDALYADANLQVTANAEGKCYKDLLFGDSPSQVQAKMSQYKDLSPLVPKALTQYGLQYNDNDLAYAGYFAGLPVIVRCMFVSEGAGSFSLTAVSFTHLVGGYNTDATAVTTAFGLQDAETKAKWQTLLGDSQGAFNTSMNALSDFLKASQQIQQQRLQSRDVAVKFEKTILAAGYVGTKKAPDGSVSYTNPRRINATLAYNDNLVNLQLTDLRGLYQATLNDRLDAFDKTAKELSSAMASDAASVNNTVNDLNGNSTPPSSVPIPASPTTPASIPTDSSPPLERSSPVMPVSGTPSGKCKPGENFTNSIGIEMIWMAPLKCWVSKYDVTQEQYEKVTGNNPSTYQGARMPVETVSWNEGVAYAKKLTLMERTANLLPEGYQYSLPTDAQYDVYVGNASLDDAVTSQSESRSSPATVGSKGANNFGLYDTRGNVWQWCLDWYRADMNSSEIRDNNSALNDDGGGQKFKVLRGASWGHDDSDYLTTSFRSYNDPGIRRDRNGIRVVLVPHGG